MYHWHPLARNLDNALMELPIYQVDAFASRQFAGNPAAVVPLQQWLPDSVLQSIAAENNLAETAFFVPLGDTFHLRWFTPLAEVDLCGHATLASAFVLFSELGFPHAEVRFDTLSGRLGVRRSGSRLVMDFPATPAHPVAVSKELIHAVGLKPKEVLQSRDIVFIYEDSSQVAKLQPHMEALTQCVPFGLIATAPGTDCDFVSRFFAPAKGVPEDPVTGSAHCTLVPYWAQRLGKVDFFARQVSRRGGEIWCGLEGDRVRLEGEAAFYLRGTITVAGV
jgi:PhzF family phenazine biosynthesis protein